MSLPTQDKKMHRMQSRTNVKRAKVSQKKESYMIHKKRAIDALTVASREKGGVKIWHPGHCRLIYDRIRKAKLQSNSNIKLSQLDKEEKIIDRTRCDQTTNRLIERKTPAIERISIVNQSQDDILAIVGETSNFCQKVLQEYQSDEIYELNIEESKATLCGATDKKDETSYKPQRSQFKFRLGRRTNRTGTKHQDHCLDIHDLIENEPEFQSRRSKSIDTAVAMSLMPALSITPNAFNQLASNNNMIARLPQDVNKAKDLKTLSSRSQTPTRAKSGKRPCTNHRLEHQNAVESAERPLNHPSDKENFNHFKTNSHQFRNSNSKLMRSRRSLSKQNSETNKSECSRSLSPPAPATGMHNWMMRNKMMMDRMVHVGQRPLKASEIRAAEEAAKRNKESASKPSDGCGCGCGCGCNCCHCNAEVDNKCNSASCQCKCCTDEKQNHANTENELQQRPWLTMLPRNLFLSEHKKNNNNNCTCKFCHEKERNNISDVSVSTVTLSTADKRISTEYNNKDEICQVEREEWPSQCRDCSSCGGIGCQACKDSQSSHRSEFIHKASSPRGFPRRTSTQETNKCKCTHCKRDDISEYSDEHSEKPNCESIKNSTNGKNKNEGDNKMTECNSKLSHKSMRSNSSASSNDEENCRDHQSHCCCGKCGFDVFEKQFAEAALKGLKQYMEEVNRQVDKEERIKEYDEQGENELAKFVSENTKNSITMENTDSLDKKDSDCKSHKGPDETKSNNHGKFYSDGSIDVNYSERCSPRSSKGRLPKARRCQSPSHPIITVDDDSEISENESDNNDDLYFKHNSRPYSSTNFIDEINLNEFDGDHEFEINKFRDFSRPRSSSPTKRVSNSARHSAHDSGLFRNRNNHFRTIYDKELEILERKSKKQGLFCEPLYAELLPTAARVRRWEKWIEEKERIEAMKRKIRGPNELLNSLNKFPSTIRPTRCNSPYRTNGPHRYEYPNDLETIPSNYPLFAATQTKEPLVRKKESIALSREPKLSHKTIDQESEISSLEQSTSNEYSRKEEKDGNYVFKRHNKGSVSYPDLCVNLRSSSPSFPYDLNADDKCFYLSRSMKDVCINSASMQDVKTQYGNNQSIFSKSSILHENKPLLFRILNNEKRNYDTFLPQSSLTNFLNHIKPLLSKQSEVKQLLSSYTMNSTLEKDSFKSMINLPGLDRI